MSKSKFVNPFFEQITNNIRNDFSMCKEYKGIESDLDTIYDSLSNNSYNNEFDKYTNNYINLFNSYVLFNKYINDNENYKYAFDISNLFINIKSYLYLYIKNKYGYNKKISN